MPETARIDIRLLTESDMPTAMRLKEFAGWNQTEDDWRCLLQLEPQGCFAAILDGDLVGTTTTTTYGHELAWIGMVLVHPTKRRLGIATKLLEVALDYLSQRVATVKLDATSEGRPVYERFGFEVETSIERWSGVANKGVVRRPESDTLIDLHEVDKNELFTLDQRAFCADRTRLIEKLIDSSNVGPVVVKAEDNSLTGYGLARKGSHATYVGPVISTRSEQTAVLVDAVLDQSKGGRTYIDLNTSTNNGPVILAERGFTKQRDLIRMRYGRPAGFTSPLVFAIAGPEIG